MSTIYIILLIIVLAAHALIFSLLCRKLAEKKNRDINSWSVIGFLFGIFSYIVLFFMSELKEPPTSENQRLNWIATPGTIIGVMYLLYSIISIVLSFLDRTYSNVEINFLFFIVGVIFMVFATAFRSRQKWGWFGYTALLILIGIFSVFNIDTYKIILGILALGTLLFTVAPATRKLYFTS